MGEVQQPGTGVVETPARSGRSMALWAFLALLAHVGLIDAAVETFWSGSPLRWWISPGLILPAALSVWLWRPAGGLLRRFGPAAAAATPVIILLAVLAISAWLPGGQENGVQMFLQPTTRALIVVVALAVLLAGGILFGGMAVFSTTPRLVARAACVALTLYALASLGLALSGGASFSNLFNGSAAWQRLPAWLQGASIGALGLLPLAILAQVLRVVLAFSRRKSAGLPLGLFVIMTAVLAVAVSGLVATSPRGVVGLDTVVRPFEMTVDEMVRLIKAYQEVPGKADRSGFDVKAKAATVPGISEAFVFVRDQIANDLYRGVLRGAEGTLSASAGNDADKAVLLAGLLAEQKRTVRFARCELPVEKADARIRSTFSRPRRSSSGVADELLLAALVRQGLQRGRAAEIVAARRTHEQAIDSMVTAAAQADLASVRDALRAANIVPAPRVDRAALVAAARSHFWVQVEAQDGSWQDLDAAFPDAQPGSAFCVAEQTMGNLPASEYQTATVMVNNEYLGANGELTTTTAFRHTFRTVDLHARLISFANTPLPLADVAAGGLTAVKGFVPILVVGDDTFIGNAFPLVSSPPQGQQVGAGSMLGPLGGGEEAKPPGQPAVLVGQSLNFSIEAPGQKSAVSRAIFDGVRPDERVNGRIATLPDDVALVRELTSNYAIAVSTGRIEPVQMLEAAYGRMDAAAVGRVLGVTSPEGLSDDVITELIRQQPLWLWTRALRFASELDDLQSAAWCDAYLHTAGFRAEPLIVIANLASGPDGEIGLSFDLRHDEMRVLGDGREYDQEAFWRNAHHGVVDGAVERAALPSATVISGKQHPASESAAQVISTSTVAEVARATGIGFTAATGDAAVRTLRGLGAPGGYRIASEVGEGIAAVMPAKPVRVGGGDRLGAWTVNVGTGHLVPLLDSGLRHATGMLAPQPTGEYSKTTEKTRDIDIWWRKLQSEMDKVIKLRKEYQCGNPANKSVECEILLKALNKLFMGVHNIKPFFYEVGQSIGPSVF